MSQRKIEIEEREIDGQTCHVVSLADASNEELSEVFEKLVLQRDKLMPSDYNALGARIVEFYMTGWPEGATHEDYEEHLVDNEDAGDLQVEMTEMYDLRHFGVVVGELQDDYIRHGISFADAFRAWEEEKYGDPRKKTKRYPHTFAADLLRMKGPHEGISPTLSRSDAFQLLQIVAAALSLADVTVAEALADYYLSHSEEILKESIARIEKEW